MKYLSWVALIALSLGCGGADSETVMTVLGPVPAGELGTTLVHEHVLVDFIGAEATGYERWDRDEVQARVLPFLQDIRQRGVTTVVECTPAFIGRDPWLLRSLSQASGLHILTNTGYYGASDNKFLPPHAWTESADDLARRWIHEFEQGLEDSGVRPGFMKIGVGSDIPLSDVHRKLVQAAARTHLRTGLTIASHTGPAAPALEEVAILEEEGVHPSALIWVHAQSETDFRQYEVAARKGVWISLDGIAGNPEAHLARLTFCREKGLLDHVLLSHDAGWYSPGEPAGGEFTPYTALFDRLIPAMKQEGFTDQEIHRLTVENPGAALSVRIRALD